MAGEKVVEELLTQTDPEQTQSKIDESVGADLPISKYCQTSALYVASEYTSYSSVGSTYDRSKAVNAAVDDFVEANLPLSEYTQTDGEAAAAAARERAVAGRAPAKTVDDATSMEGDAIHGVDDATNTEAIARQQKGVDDTTSMEDELAIPPAARLGAAAVAKAAVDGRATSKSVQMSAPLSRYVQFDAPLNRYVQCELIKPVNPKSCATDMEAVAAQQTRTAPDIEAMQGSEEGGASGSDLKEPSSVMNASNLPQLGSTPGMTMTEGSWASSNKDGMTKKTEADFPVSRRVQTDSTYMRKASKTSRTSQRTTTSSKRSAARAGVDEQATSGQVASEPTAVVSQSQSRKNSDQMKQEQSQKNMAQQNSANFPLSARTQANFPMSSAAQSSMPMNKGTAADCGITGGIQASMPLNAGTNVNYGISGGTHVDLPLDTPAQAGFPMSGGVQADLPSDQVAQANLPMNAGVGADFGVQGGTQVDWPMEMGVNTEGGVSGGVQTNFPISTGAGGANFGISGGTQVDMPMDMCVQAHLGPVDEGTKQGEKGG